MKSVRQAIQVLIISFSTFSFATEIHVNNHRPCESTDFELHAQQVEFSHMLRGGCLFSSKMEENRVAQAVIRTFSNKSNSRKFSKVIYIVSPYTLPSGLISAERQNFGLEDSLEAYFEETLNSLGKDPYQGRLGSFNDLSERLRYLGFDLVVIGFPATLNSLPLSIKANAFSEVIKKFQYARANAGITSLDGGISDKHDAVIGLSLGGVIARYGLADLERNYPQERVSIETYISVDSPHLGANIPISLQATLRFIKNAFGVAADDNDTWYNQVFSWALDSGSFLGDYLDTLHLNQTDIGDKLREPHRNFHGAIRALNEAQMEAIAALSALDTYAVKELAINHIDFPNGNNIYRQNLLNNLYALGFPEHTTNISFTNGSLQGRRVIHRKKYIDFVSKRYESTEWMLNAGSTKHDYIFRGTFRYPKKYLLGTEIKYYRNSISNESWIDVDEGNCSKSNTPLQMVEVLKSSDQFSSKYGLLSQFLEHESCFIPVSSALAIKTSDYNRKVLKENSPFDYIIGYEELVRDHLNLDATESEDDHVREKLFRMVLGDYDLDGLSFDQEKLGQTNPKVYDSIDHNLVANDDYFNRNNPDSCDDTMTHYIRPLQNDQGHSLSIESVNIKSISGQFRSLSFNPTEIILTSDSCYVELEYEVTNGMVTKAATITVEVIEGPTLWNLSKIIDDRNGSDYLAVGDAHIYRFYLPRERRPGSDYTFDNLTLTFNGFGNDFRISHFDEFPEVLPRIVSAHGEVYQNVSDVDVNWSNHGMHFLLVTPANRFGSGNYELDINVDYDN